MAARVLVLSSTTSYRTDDFMRAAARLGVEAVLGTNRCHELAELWPREAFGGSVPIEFRHEAEAADVIVREHARGAVRRHRADGRSDRRHRGARGGAAGAARQRRRRGDDGAQQAAHARGAARRWGRLSPLQRARRGRRSGARVARARRRRLARSRWWSSRCSARRAAASSAPTTRRRSSAAWRRLHALLQTPALRAVEDADGHRVLVESFVPGAEVALEGLLARRRADDAGAVRQARSARRALLRGDDLRDAVAARGRAAARGRRGDARRLRRHRPRARARSTPSCASRPTGAGGDRGGGAQHRRAVRAHAALRARRGSSLEELVIRNALGGALGPTS